MACSFNFLFAQNIEFLETRKFDLLNYKIEEAENTDSTFVIFTADRTTGTETYVDGVRVTGRNLSNNKNKIDLYQIKVFRGPMSLSEIKNK